MAHIRIEMDRGNGWEQRQEGDCDVTAGQLREMLPGYAIQYPHRALLDGEVVAEAQASPASAADCGPSSPGSLARYDRATSSWRTSQRSFLEGWETFSETWPRSGMMRSGTAFPLRPLALLTSGIEFGLWPIPTTSEQNIASASAETRERSNGICLADAVRKWSTPTTRDAESFKKVSRGSGSMAKGNQIIEPLAVQVQRFPTPTTSDANGTRPPDAKRGPIAGLQGAVSRSASPAARDWRSDRGRSENGHTPQLPEQMGGQLNPDWVEALMGLPVGWTRVE